MKKTVIIVIILIICFTGCKTTKSENAVLNSNIVPCDGDSFEKDILSQTEETEKESNNNYTSIDVLYDKKLDIPYTINSYAVNCYYITELNMYIGTRNGLFISKDRGKTWKLFDKSLVEEFIYAIFVDEFKTIYLGTYSGLLVYSTEQKQWIINNPLGPITSICVNENTIILGSIDNSIYLSYDHGKTWEKKDKLIPIEYVMFSGNNIINIICEGSKIFILSNLSKIAISLDNGKTWKKINLITDIPYSCEIQSIAIFNNKLYVSCGWKYSYSSEDDGITWKREIIDDDDILVYSIAATESQIYILTSHGIYTQYSDKWQFVGPEKLLDFSPRTPISRGSLVVYKNMMMVNTKQYRVLISENYGKNWEKNVASGISNFYAKGNLIMCGTQYGLNISQDKGKTWKRVSKLNGLENDYIISLGYSGENIIIGTEYLINYGGGVYRSKDFGLTWSNRYLKNLTITSVKCYGNKVYVTSRFAPKNFHMIDLNTNQVKSLGIEDSLRDFIIFEDKIYISSWGGEYPLYVSENYGQNWKGVLKGVLHSLDMISGIAFLNDNLVLGTGKNGIILLNADYKIIKEIKNLPGISIMCLLTKNDTIFAGTSKGLAVSNDSGETWKTFENLNMPIKGMCIDSTKLYISTTYECHVLDIIQK